MKTLYMYLLIVISPSSFAGEVKDLLNDIELISNACYEFPAYCSGKSCSSQFRDAAECLNGSIVDLTSRDYKNKTSRSVVTKLRALSQICSRRTSSLYVGDNNYSGVALYDSPRMMCMIRGLELLTSERPSDRQADNVFLQACLWKISHMGHTSMTAQTGHGSTGCLLAAIKAIPEMRHMDTNFCTKRIKDETRQAICLASIFRRNMN